MTISGSGVFTIPSGVSGYADLTIVCKVGPGGSFTANFDVEDHTGSGGNQNVEFILRSYTLTQDEGYTLNQKSWSWGSISGDFALGTHTPIISNMSTYGYPVAVLEITISFTGSAPPPVFTFTVTTAASPSGAGTQTGGGTYSLNATCNISAMPASGYRFLYWKPSVSLTGAFDPVSASTSFTVKSSVTVTACYAAKRQGTGLLIYNG